jgi:hypothetical protein
LDTKRLPKIAIVVYARIGRHHQTFSKLPLRPADPRVQFGLQLVLRLLLGLGLSRAMTYAWVSTRPSWALLAQRLEPLVHSLQVVAKPHRWGETERPRFLSSLATRT